MRKIFSLFLAIPFVLGCSFLFATHTPTPDARSSAGGWTSITMNLSGGIMGLSRSIQISSDGTFSVTDDHPVKKVNGILLAADLSELNQKIAALNIPPNQPNGAICADCFVYDLNIQGQEINTRVQLSDVTLPESGFESLVTFLRGLAAELLR